MMKTGKADAGREAGRGWTWRQAIGIGCVAALHLAALYALLSTEYGPFAITLSLLAWLVANCLVLLVLPRPGIAAALSLMITVALIACSRFKFDILQLSLTFLDFLIIDRDTFSFLLSVFPRLKMPLLVAAIAAVPALWLIWRTDPFRISRKISLALLGVRNPVDLGDGARRCRSSRGSRSRASTTSPTSRAPAWSRCRASPQPDGSRPIRRRSPRCLWRAARTPRRPCCRCRRRATLR